MNLNRMLATTLSTAIGCLSLSAPANAVIVSEKTFGMAATGVAYPQDAFAAAFNPAGAVEINDRIDIGVTWNHTTGGSKVQGNIFDAIPPIHAALGGNVNGTFPGYKTKDFYSADFGINKRLGECGQWAVGLVVYNRNFVKTTFNKPFVLFGTSNPGLEYLNETISPVIAYRINESHNIGLTVNCQVERLKVNGIEKFTQPSPFTGLPRSVSPNNVTNKGYDWSVGWGVTLGWQWHITDSLTFGATYQPRTSMPKLKKYKGFIAEGKLDVPQMWSVGLAWKYCDYGTIAFDVQQYDWDGVRALHNNLEHNGVVEPLGAKHGPGFGFKTQTFYRLGIDYMISCDWTVRAGFRYGRAPFGPSQTAVNQLTLDTCEYFATCGASFRPNECNEISAFFAYGFEKKIKGKNSIPPGAPIPLPTQPIPNPNGFGGGEADVHQRQIVLGVSWGYDY